MLPRSFLAFVLGCFYSSIKFLFALPADPYLIPADPYLIPDDPYLATGTFPPVREEEFLLFTIIGLFAPVVYPVLG